MAPQSLESRVTGLEHDMENIQKSVEEIKVGQTEMIRKQDANTEKISGLDKKIYAAMAIVGCVPVVIEIFKLIKGH